MAWSTMRAAAHRLHLPDHRNAVLLCRTVSRLPADKIATTREHIGRCSGICRKAAMRYTNLMASRFRLLLTTALAALSSCCLNVSMVDIPPLSPQEPVARLAVAHRGSLHSGLPDNSIAALRQSIAAGVPFLEVDVRRSSEGDLFLFHDGSLQSSNSKSPGALWGEPVQALSRQQRDSVELGSGQHIPLLAAALDTIRGSGSALQLDFKGESDSLVFAALDLLHARGQLNEALLQIRKPTRIPIVLAYAPKARILARVRSEADLREALRYQIEYVELERWATPEAIREAHSSSIKVLANVSGTRLDEPLTWDYLRSRGFDTIMTNHADQALEPTLR